jgi:hypothetical protein
MSCVSAAGHAGLLCLIVLQSKVPQLYDFAGYFRLFLLENMLKNVFHRVA